MFIFVAVLLILRYNVKQLNNYLFAGGLFGVEKVKPDPLNLLVNTGVGSKTWAIFVPLPTIWQGFFNAKASERRRIL
jgi:hypothetical protein